MGYTTSISGRQRALTEFLRMITIEPQPDEGRFLLLDNSPAASDRKTESDHWTNCSDSSELRWWMEDGVLSFDFYSFGPAMLTNLELGGELDVIHAAP